jgi:hypothetical protein
VVVLQSLNWFIVLDHLLLNPELLEPEELTLDVPTEFAASLNARGLYSTIHFVVRLSPKIHRLLGMLPDGVHARSDVDAETAQAFSTYLHETVHWWQHIGSTAGLMLSLAYPAQAHQNIDDLRTVLRLIGPKKSLLLWAENAARDGMTDNEPVLSSANIAVNNAIDAEFYKLITLNPAAVAGISTNRYFESVGHCYCIAYSHAIGLISATVDREQKRFSDAGWDEGLRQARDSQVEGFVYRGAVRVAPLGLRALFEGQARFLQLQYLTFGVSDPPTCRELRANNCFRGIYGEAFEAFLKITGASWPEKVHDPIVGLFLLVIDLAINPTMGFPFDIESFENFIIDVDPGIRFLRLAQAARDRPDLLSAITDYTRDKYLEVSEILTEACGYEHPVAALQEVANWATDLPGVAEIMTEKETFDYKPVNLVVRVLFSYFVSFYTDKLRHPEFFCWTGAWMAGSRVGENSLQLFQHYQPLFSDKADDEGIFARKLPGKEEDRLTKTLSIFYGNIVGYDLTRQWILKEGAFTYDYDWLSQTHSAGKVTQWAKELFHRLYGVSPDDFYILRP